MEIGHSIIHELSRANVDLHNLNTCIKGNGPILHSYQSCMLMNIIHYILTLFFFIPIDNQTLSIPCEKKKYRIHSLSSPAQDFLHKPENIIPSSVDTIRKDERNNEEEKRINLPIELLDLVFSYCDLKSLMALNCVCKKFTKCWSSVLYLDLRKESLEHCKKLIHYHLPKLKNIKTLILPPIRENVGIIDALCELTSLENLAIPSIHYIESNKIQKLSKLTRLLSLSINLASNFKSDKLSFLKSLTKLEHLKIEIFQYSIMERLSEHIVLLSNLRSIDFSWCKNITCKFLLNLCQLENLHVLKFDMCLDLKDSELEAISSIKTLVELSFRWCQFLTDKGVLFLAALPHLEKLNLSNCPHITPQGISVLPKTCKVKILPFRWCNLEK